jgi:hypothetical protein
MRAFALIAVLLTAGAAQARDFAFQFMFGVNAESNPERAKLQSGDTIDANGEDLETNIGMMAFFDTLVLQRNQHVKVGGRLGYLQANGEDSKARYTTVDGGLSVRLIFPQIRALPFVQFGAGATYMSISELTGFETDATGIGYHFIIGGGLEHPITPTMNMIFSAYFTQQTANLEAENNRQEMVDIEGNAIQRLIFAAGGVF